MDIDTKLNLNNLYPEYRNLSSKIKKKRVEDAKQLPEFRK